MYTKQKAPYSAKTALYGALFKNTDKKKGAPPGGTNKPGGDYRKPKSSLEHSGSLLLYHIASDLSSSSKENTRPKSGIFPERSETRITSGSRKTAPRLRFAGRHGKKIIGGCLIPMIPNILYHIFAEMSRGDAKCCV
jgi:hypothetical protein